MTASILFALLFYLATALLVAGLGAKIVRYARTPAPLKIPTTPAPTTAGSGAIFGPAPVTHATVARSEPPWDVLMRVTGYGPDAGSAIQLME